MLKVTFKIDEKKYDYEFDQRQKISDVLNKIYERNNIKSKDINKIRLELDKRTIDVENTFLEMDIKNNEIITVLN